MSIKKITPTLPRATGASQQRLSTAGYDLMLFALLTELGGEIRVPRVTFTKVKRRLSHFRAAIYETYQPFEAIFDSSLQTYVIRLLDTKRDTLRATMRNVYNKASFSPTGKPPTHSIQ